MTAGNFTLRPLLQALKVRVTAIYQRHDKLYLGTTTGQIRVYSFKLIDGQASPDVKLVGTYTVAKKAIDQIGVLLDEDKLAVLCDSTISLHSLQEISKPPKVLAQARSAHSFAISSNGSNTILFIGCRKKVVVYGAGKGGFKECWELSLPHSPRQIVLPTARKTRSAHLLYSSSSSVLLRLDSDHTPHLSVSDETSTTHSHAPERQSSSGEGASGSGSGLSMGMGVSALTGLGGYVRLGNRGPLPVGTRTLEGEAVIAREDHSIFMSSEGTSTRDDTLQWSAPPESLAFSNPFLYALVPHVGSTSSATPASTLPTCAVQIHLTPTLHLQQTLALPLPIAGGIAATSLCSVTRSEATLASTVAPSTKALFISTPLDKSLAANEGSSIWSVEVGDLGDVVDEMVRQGRVEDAFGLVEAVGEMGFSPSRRLPHLKTLSAVQQFAHGEYQPAMETFVKYEVNPALVISLFPADTISGRLHLLRNDWMELFGAVDGALLSPTPAVDPLVTKSLLSKVSRQINKKSSVDTMESSSKEGEDTVTGAAADAIVLPRAAFEALMYFLSDRRQKLAAPMATTTVPAESTLPPLSSLAAETLHALPSVSFTELDPENLLRMAQVVYTALIKVYLVARPILVGSLCRIENWCDVEEVEELLKAQKKFGDLIDLYQGKKQHKKALAMLHDLAKDEEDRLDRYPPTVEYLQKLGPSELPLILESSRWIFEEDSKMALQIFTADKAEVEALPRMEVMRFLEGVDDGACVGYLEHIINDLGETRADFHDRLAELYHGESEQTGNASKLISFLRDSTHYRPYRLLNKISSKDLPGVKAILLGRLGRHEEALRIYIYQLKDYTAAESYCAKVYASEPDPKGIFLLLLRLYLHPSTSDPVLIDPALSMIATHGVRLDADSVLDILPPLVTMRDLQAFFVKTLRDGHAKKNDARIVKQLATARKEQVERILMDLQVHRVRITDQRICPHCHKRLGQSAIAVHAPRGEVTHLHCKDSFSTMLAEVRG